MSSLQSLILANNQFNGTIPECLRNFEVLVFLDLSMNHFHGSISTLFPNNSNLETINLNGNQFEGPLPTSLVNYSSLEVFDVGNNMLNGTFPSWLETVPELQILILRSNRFHGPIRISGAKLSFPKLRIIDIAHNQFTGTLSPKLFLSFKSMMSDRVRVQDQKTRAVYMDTYYSMVLTWKGIDLQFDRILTILTTIDLSSNQFEGEIPETVAELNLLKVLNLSHNHLTGQIPSSLRNLTELESLDFSTNKLRGKILIQLTRLTFLEKLNLSYNRLDGRIPMGRQFDTFDNTSYIGNSGLCGQPLLRKCIEDKASELVQRHEDEEEEDTRSWFWKMVKMGYASGVVIGLSIGYMVFTTGKPWWFVKRFEKNKFRMWVRRDRGSCGRRN